MATTETVTLTKALTVLKNIDKEFNELSIPAADFVTVGIGKNKTTINGKSFTEQTAKIQATHDRLNALVKRQLAFKKAVFKANAETMIDIGERKVSINDLMAERKLLPTKRLLLSILKKASNDAVLSYQKQKQIFDARVEQMVGASKPEGCTAADVQALMEAIANQQTDVAMPYIIDPMDIGEKIDSLEQEIKQLTTDLDERLSVVNATTTITVEY